jgi:hypothetical protein
MLEHDFETRRMVARERQVTLARSGLRDDAPKTDVKDVTVARRRRLRLPLVSVRLRPARSGS